MPPTTPETPASPRLTTSSWLLATVLVFVVATALASLACPASAQDHQRSGSFEGVVVLLPGAEPAVGAVALVVESGTRVVANSQGIFSLPSLPAGTWTIEVTHPGFRPERRAIRVHAGARSEAAFSLQPLERVLSEVVVTPSRYTLYANEPQVQTSLSRSEVSELPHFAQDVFRAVRWVPGVTGEELSAQPNVRGGDADETLVIIDGLEVQDGFHLKELFNLQSIIDAEVVGSLEFSSGGFPVQYGNRLSGVIDISSLTTGTARTSAGISTTSLGLLSEGQLGEGRGRWLVSARRTDLDAVIEWVDPDNGLEPDFYDVVGTFSYGLGSRTVLAAHVLASRDNTGFEERDGYLEEKMDASSSNTYAWVTLKTAWTPRLFSHSVVSYGRVEKERSGFIDYWHQAGTVDDSRSFDVMGLRQDWSLDLSRRHSVRWGLDVRSLDASYEYNAYAIVRDPLFIGNDPPHVTEREINLEPSGQSYAAYAVDRFKLGRSMVAELGVRWDRQTYASDSQWSPRLNLVWEAGPRTSVRAAWGHFHQPQAIHELQVTDGETTFHPAQRAEHRVLSAEHRLAGGVELRLDVFDKILTDVRPRFQNLLNPVEVFPEIEADRVLVAPERARVRGVELGARRTGRRASWWLSYAYQKALDRIDGEWVPRSWDQPHTASAGITWRPSERWSLNLSGIYHSGWPTTAVVAEAFPVQGGYYLTVNLGPRNRERLPHYLRFDIRASRDFRVRRSLCSLFVEVTNVANRDNLARPESYSFELRPDGTVRTVIDWESYMPVIPALGVRWTF